MSFSLFVPRISLLTWFSLALLPFAGCHSAASTDSAPASVSAAATSHESDSGDCNAFLKGYEEYVDDYVALTKEMKDNPSNTELLAKSSALSMKAAQWASKAKGCENDPDFLAKYTALSTKMAMGMAQ